jgi:hypothetical protein
VTFTDQKCSFNPCQRKGSLLRAMCIQMSCPTSHYPFSPQHNFKSHRQRSFDEQKHVKGFI